MTTENPLVITEERLHRAAVPLQDIPELAAPIRQKLSRSIAEAIDRQAYELFNKVK